MNSGFLAEIDAKTSVQSATKTCSPIFANQMDSMSGIKFDNIVSCSDLISKTLKIQDPPPLMYAFFNPNVAKSAALAGTFWPELRAIRRAAAASTGAMPAVDTRMYTRHTATHKHTCMLGRS